MSELRTEVFSSDGREVKLGDTISYWRLYEDHSDAVDCYGVEPQCNWDVHEVYVEKITGKVEFKQGSYRVNGESLYDLSNNIINRIIDLSYYGLLGLPLKAWVQEEKFRLDIDSSFKRFIQEIEIIGDSEDES